MARDTKRFPLREAYQFAEHHGLAPAGTAIRDMEVEWDRNYNSSVRRGRLIKLFEEHGLLKTFFRDCWPAGETRLGQQECRRCLRIAAQYDDFVSGQGIDVASDEQDTNETKALEFALEAHLRDFLAKNLDRVEPGLRLYSDNDTSGAEFPIDGGRIDILAVDTAGKFVVIELKVSQGRNKTLGQLLYYMGWVDKTLGSGPCRGLIVASNITDDLLTAVARVPGVRLAKYRMSFAIENVDPVS